MQIVTPSTRLIPNHLGSWRAMCSCRRLDGPERATRGDAVDDHAAHITDIETRDWHKIAQWIRDNYMCHFLRLE